MLYNQFPLQTVSDTRLVECDAGGEDVLQSGNGTDKHAGKADMLLKITKKIKRNTT